MSDAGKIMKRIKDEEIEWVDLRFTDPRGKWQHLSMVSGIVDEDQLTDGFMFDGSSIAGWKAINESDMILKPDLAAAYLDPFSAEVVHLLRCDHRGLLHGLGVYGNKPDGFVTEATTA